jgi:hypothetical protein
LDAWAAIRRSGHCCSAPTILKRRTRDPDVLALCGYFEQMQTRHDLRRTARSLLSRALVPTDIAERCLAHSMGTIRGTYDLHAYYHEKRQAFAALAQMVLTIGDPTAASNVISLARGA